MNDQERIRHVARMEEICDKCGNAVGELLRAAECFQSLEPELRILEEYYLSPAWLEDRDADQAGRIPGDLKRGILAEDTIYDLLTDVERMKHLLKELTWERRNCSEPAEETKEN